METAMNEYLNRLNILWITDCNEQNPWCSTTPLIARQGWSGVCFKRM